MNIVNGALDSYDERNYPYSEVCGTSQELPSYIKLDTGGMQNQRAEGYKYGCVYFSASEASNYSALTRSKGGDLCDESDTRNPDAGDYIKNGPKLITKKGIIEGYAQVSSLYDIKHSLANKRLICTGSNQIDWSKTKYDPFVAEEKSAYGHAFFICGYDDLAEHLICQNSYGVEEFDEGYFYINYSDVDKLLYGTRLSLIEDKDSIIAYKKRIMEGININDAKRAFTAGIWNGTEPTGKVSREECAAMVMRAINKINKNLQNN